MEIDLPYNFDVDQRPFQAQIWDSPKMNKLLCVPRRHGKTSLAINYLISEAIQNTNKVYWYVCPTQRQAKEVVWKAPDMINRYLPPQAVKNKNEVELCIYFKNGAQIHIKGADDPDSLRGTNPFGIIMDEYAQIKPQLYDEILMPIVKANGGWVWLMGTPKGRNDFFIKYQRLAQNPNWQVLKIKASEAGILSNEVLTEARQSMTERAFSQEFETEFLEGAGQVFRRIKENATSELREPESNVDYVLGVDLARVQDWTVIKVFNTKNWQEVYSDRFNQIDWNLQKARIEAIARRYNNALIRVDATGAGDIIAEDLKNQGLMVEAFVFTNNSKKNIMQNLSMLLESDQIKILPDDITIKELEAFTFEVGSTGTIKYSAPEGLHDDAVCSLALAVWQLPVKELKPLDDYLSTNKSSLGYNEWGEPVYT